MVYIAQAWAQLTLGDVALVSQLINPGQPWASWATTSLSASDHLRYRTRPHWPCDMSRCQLGYGGHPSETRKIALHILDESMLGHQEDCWACDSERGIRVPGLDRVLSKQWRQFKSPSKEISALCFLGSTHTICPSSSTSVPRSDLWKIWCS